MNIKSVMKECIRMIPKKENKSCLPADYRPISLTSCIGKVVERDG